MEEIQKDMNNMFLSVSVFKENHVYWKSFKYEK